MAIIDLNLNLTKSYGDLLSDVLSLREALRLRLKANDVARLDSGVEVYVGILAAGGYEWSVAILAVLALGAAAVPMSVNQPVAEVEYLVGKAKLVGLVCGREGVGLGREVVEGMDEEGPPVVVSVLDNLPEKPRWRVGEMVIDSGRCLDDNAPALVIFTSGTT